MSVALVLLGFVGCALLAFSACSESEPGCASSEDCRQGRICLLGDCHFPKDTPDDVLRAEDGGSGNFEDANDCECPVGPQVKDATCASGDCRLVCESGFGNCNHVVSDGCETNIMTSTEYCGGCETDAARTNCTQLPHVAESSCALGTCVIQTCQEGFSDCNLVVADGCENQLSVDGPCCNSTLVDHDNDGETCDDRCPYDAGFIGECPSKKFVIDPGSVDCRLEDFPILVNIRNDQELKEAREDGLDLFFSTDTGPGDLAFEIERWDHESGSLTAWVRLPEVVEDSATVFYLRYGDGSGIQRANAEAVWDDAHAAVYHMDYGGGAGLQSDSTVNDNDLSPFAASNPPSRVEGPIGDALHFQPRNGMLVAPDKPSLDMVNTMSISMWAKRSETNPNFHETLISKRVPPSETCNYQIGLTWGTRNLLFYDGQPEHSAVESATSPAAEIWQHIAVTVGLGGQCTFYVDGVQVAESGGCELTPNDGPLSVGGTDQEQDEPFFGALDEVRISNVARADCWVRASYENQRSGSTFLSVGN